MHELCHAVRVLWPQDDGIPDFLAVDHPNLDHIPDTLYCSDGRVVSVEQATNAQVDAPASAGHLIVHLTCTAPSAWMYLRINDPGLSYVLLRAVRSDGSVIELGDNLWTTHRTVHALGMPDYPEDLLHLFDYQSTGDYTLYYGMTVPLAVNDAYSVNAGATLSVAAPGVLGNDTNSNGTVLSATLVTTPGNGSLTLNADGSFSYTPNAGFYGTDSFTYTATDGHATSAPATVTITVYSVPVANADAYTVIAGNTLTVAAARACWPTIPMPTAARSPRQLASSPAHGQLTLECRRLLQLYAERRLLRHGQLHLYRDRMAWPLPRRRR